MPQPLPASTQAALDASLARLQARKTHWARLPIAHKRDLLRACLRRLGQFAPGWVKAAIEAKGIPAESSLVGEEWITGIWAQAITLRELSSTLDALANGETPTMRGVRTRRGGQTVVDVFPHDRTHALLMNGIRAEVWMQPGVAPVDVPGLVGRFYQQEKPVGAVALVLGAGNVNSIPTLDVLSELINKGRVVLLKLNPVNAYLRPFIEQIYAPLIDGGYLAVTAGGGDVGAYLTDHDAVDTVHITGSIHTHDAIVFGTGQAGAARKAQNRPRLQKPITSELGGVGPVIVVPGPWTDEDIRFQAEHIITMKLQNEGFNCVAAQVLILPHGWPGTAKLLNAIREGLRTLPPRHAYYPGAEQRQQAAVAAHPGAETFTGDVPRTLITDVPPDADAACFSEEYFGPVLAQTSLPAPDAATYLQQAVAFCNERLFGTLGATLLAHPQTITQLGDTFEDALEALHYGAVAVNAWNGNAYMIVQCPWGAAPGHTLNDVQSGIGTVHNTYLLDETQKVVVHGPFAPLPRSLSREDKTLLPRPPWFITHPNMHAVGKQFAYLAIDQHPLRSVSILINALRGGFS